MGHSRPTSEALICPTCASEHPGDERFCADCGVPLVHGPGSATPQKLTERHLRARKIKPQLAEGSLVRVAGASNQAEGEFVQGLLLEEGVPSLLRRSAGFDVPDFLAAGPRDVMVPAAGVATAREVLLEAELISPHPERAVVAPARLLAALVAAFALGAVVIWLATVLLAH